MTAVDRAPAAGPRAPAVPPRTAGWADRFSPAWVLVPGVLAVAAAAGMSVVVSRLAPLAIVLVALFCAAVWRRPVIGAIAVAAFVPAVSGMARGTFLPGFKLSEVLLIACAGVMFLRLPRGWRPLSGVDGALLLFAAAGVGFAVLHGTVGGNLSPEGILRTGFFPAFLFATWWTASRGVEDRQDLLLVLRWVLLTSLVPAVIGVAQYLDVPGVRSVLLRLVGGGLMPGPGEGTARVTSLFPISHSFGGYLIVPAVLAAILLLRGDRDVLRRRWLFVVLMVDMAAIVLAVTVTMLAWVPFAVLAGAALARRLTRAVVLLSVAGALALVFFSDALEARLTEQTTVTRNTTDSAVPQTLQYRILVWQRDYIPLLARAAAVGFGTDTPESVLFESTENQYVTLVLRGGVGLLLAAALALGAIAVRAWRQSRVPGGGEQAAAMTILAILLFLPAAAMVWPYVTNAGFPQSLIGVAGAALALERSARRGPRKVGRTLPEPVVGAGSPAGTG